MVSSESDSGRSVFGAARWAVIVVGGTTVALAPWLLGGQPLVAQEVILGGAVATFLLGIVVRQSAPPTAAASSAWQTQRWILLAAGLFVGLIAAGALNPSQRVVFANLHWRLVPQACVTWAPKSLDAPFNGVPTDQIPYVNSWRFLLIYGEGWLLAAGLALGLTERSDAWRWLKVVGGNALLLAGVCIVHRAMGEQRTLWRYWDVLGFRGSPVFFYKNHNGACLAFSLALVLALAAEARQAWARRSWEAGAVLVWIATLWVNSRVATVWATAWALAYVAWKMWHYRESGRDPRRPLAAGAAVIALAVVIAIASGATRTLNRFQNFVEAPGDFLQGGQHRVLLRQVGLEMWKDRPVFGWGGGAFVYLFDTYHPRVPAFAREVYGSQPTLNRLYAVSADCDMVEFLVEYGVAGVGLLVIAMALAVSSWWRREGWRDGRSLFVMLGLGGIVLHCAFDNIARNAAIFLLFGAVLVVSVRLRPSLDEQGTAPPLPRRGQRRL